MQMHSPGVSTQRFNYEEQMMVITI